MEKWIEVKMIRKPFDEGRRRRRRRMFGS